MVEAIILVPEAADRKPVAPTALIASVAVNGGEARTQVPSPSTTIRHTRRPPVTVRAKVAEECTINITITTNFSIKTY